MNQNQLRRDHYKILGVPRSATSDAIKKAFRKKAMELHPDKNPGCVNADEEFRKITVAYEILSNKEYRQSLDTWLMLKERIAMPPKNPINSPTLTNHVDISKMSQLEAIAYFLTLLFKK